MGKGDSSEKPCGKHEKHRDKDSDRKHRTRRENDDGDDVDRRRKHKHRKRNKDESKVNIVDNGDDEKLWVEKDIDMDGERVCNNSLFLDNILMFEPDSSSGYPNSEQS